MRRPALASVVLLAFTGACGGDSGGGDRLQVVATTTEVGDLVRNVAGPNAEVRTLLEPRADPHDYEPTPSDARALAEADLVFRSGGEVDEWLDDLIDGAGGDAKVVDLIDAILPLHRDGDEDPHWWQDPRNAVLAVGTIGRELGEQQRARSYARLLRRLDRDIARCIAAVPRERRKIVTTHDSLAYLGRRYGIEIVGALIPSLSTQAQASARDIKRLVEQIRAERVEAIFPESGLAPKLERAVARESGAKVGKRLWTDFLGGEDSGAETYVNAMRANADALVDGMTGGRRSCDSG